MNMYEIEERTPRNNECFVEDMGRVLYVQRMISFSGKEIDQIKEYVPQALSDVAHLIVAEDESGK